MLFNSIAFAIFLPIVFTIHWASTRNSQKRQNAILLLASYVFYGFWDWRFLGLILISTTTDFFVGQALGQAHAQNVRKRLLYISLGINIGLLVVFKYFNFFADSFFHMATSLGWEVDKITLDIILPVGISFYTFQTLSYTIDIYRKKLTPTQDIIAFFAFVSFFPQLMAGPIERATRLLPQFQQKRTFQYDQAVVGLQLLLWGLFKKLVIADRLGRYVDTVFAAPHEASAAGVILSLTAFAIQVYGDFSGYSDMAKGIAKLFGINLMTNFRTPFFAISIQEFWNRWHISLSTWFRDYVYIPLGGSKHGKWRWRSAIFITFLISGIWHGANYTFVIWGILLGGFYLIEATLKQQSWLQISLPKVISRGYVFAAFAFPMIFFRADSLEVSLTLFNQLGHWEGLVPAITVGFDSPIEAMVLALAGLVFCLFEWKIGKRNVEEIFGEMSRPFRWAFYYLLILFILLLANVNTAQNFIYFQF